MQSSRCRLGNVADFSRNPTRLRGARRPGGTAVKTRPSLDDQPGIAISMADGLIVMRPNGRLDLDATHALVAAVDAARFDSTVLIDLDGSSSSPVAVTGRISTT